MSAGTTGPSVGKAGGMRNALACVDKLLLVSAQAKSILLIAQEGGELFSPMVLVEALGGAQSLLDYCDVLAGELWQELSAGEVSA